LHSRDHRLQTLGYQRTLQAPDLWKLDTQHTAGVLAEKFDQAWAIRRQQADAWNAELEKGITKPGLIARVSWSFQALTAGTNYKERYAALEKHWREVDGRKHPSIALALNDTIGFFFWSGGIFKVSYGILL